MKKRLNQKYLESQSHLTEGGDIPIIRKNTGRVTLEENGCILKDIAEMVDGYGENIDLSVEEYELLIAVFDDVLDQGYIPATKFEENMMYLLTILGFNSVKANLKKEQKRNVKETNHIIDLCDKMTMSFHRNLREVK